jgi:hypothetical protein
MHHDAAVDADRPQEPSNSVGHPGTDRDGSGSPAQPVIIVRRGETEVFEALRENFRDAVIWDRRREDRRRRRQGPRATQPEPPAGTRERRRQLPDTWDRFGFLLAGLPDTPAPDKADPRRSAAGRPESESEWVVVLQTSDRGLLERLLKRFEANASVRVLLERRRDERRRLAVAIASDRRRSDRRGEYRLVQLTEDYWIYAAEFERDGETSPGP